MIKVEKLLDVIRTKYPLEKLDAGEFSTMKVSGMTFTVNHYRAEGLGHVSTMEAKGFFGLMKMDTLVIVPFEKDMPLYSYDRVLAAGNDTLFVEFFDTTVHPYDASVFNEVAKRYSSVPDRDPGKHWYDDIRLSESIIKKAKKEALLDIAPEDYLRTYINSKAEDTSDIEEKKRLTDSYVSGLIENGGPSTDVFVKKFGKEKTKEFFETVFFGNRIR